MVYLALGGLLCIAAVIQLTLGRYAVHR